MSMSTTADVPAGDAPVNRDSTDHSEPEIVAGPGRYYRWVRYIIAIGLMMGYGSLFIRDGFFRWPEEQRQAAVLEAQGRHPQMKPHSDLDIRIQRIIACTVPPAGLLLLCWTLYRSRGRYRLADNTLYVPGHPPVPLENIRQIDKTKWDRKGIVYIEYETPGSSQTGRLTLDDFVYDQKPTDAILERIEAVLVPPDASIAETAPAAQDDVERQDAETPR